MAEGTGSVRAAFRVPAAVDLTALDPRARPVGPRDKEDAAHAMAELGERLDGPQEALHGRRAVLLVLQGMDTSGKGGVIRHAAGLVNPQGLHIAAFKKPTEAERAEHFLARIRRQVPAPGRIGVFDRSHYEDVLVARVEGWSPMFDGAAGTRRSTRSRPSSPGRASLSTEALTELAPRYPPADFDVAAERERVLAGEVG